MLSSVWGPEPHWATWRIYDRPELHTLDFSLNRSISRCAQALNKSRWREHVKTRGMLLCRACVSNSNLNQSDQLHSCWRLCASQADVTFGSAAPERVARGRRTFRSSSQNNRVLYRPTDTTGASQITQSALSHAAKEHSVSRTERTTERPEMIDYRSNLSRWIISIPHVDKSRCKYYKLTNCE